MNSHPITFKLKDSSQGHDISPERVPLASLRDFSRDVEEFVQYDNKPDMEALRRGRERAAKAWADVPDSAAWVEQIRGNKP